MIIRVRNTIVVCKNMREKLCRQERCYLSKAALSFTKPNKALQYSHSVMQKNPHYNKSMINFAKKANEKSNPKSTIYSMEAVTMVNMCSNYISSSDSQFSKSTTIYNCQNYLLENINKMSISDIEHILVCLARSQSTYKFFQIFQELDVACKERICHLNLNEILYLTDIWYQLGFGTSVYNYEAVEHMTIHVQSFNRNQFVQYMFCLAVTQCFVHVNIGPKIILSIERKFDEFSHDISVEEVGIIALGLYRNKEHIEKYYLLDDIIAIVQNSLPHVTSITLGNICKVLKKSFKPYDERHLFLCSNFLSSLTPHIRSFDALCFTHILSVGTKILYMDENVVEAVCDNMIQNPQEARPKDVERLLYALLDNNYRPVKYSQLLNVACDVLHNSCKTPGRRSQVDIAVYNLACLEFFPAVLIYHVFREYLQNKRGLQNIAHHDTVFYLNDIVKLEGIDIPTHLQLPADDVSNFYKIKKKIKVDALLKRKAFAIESFNILSNLLGNETFCSLSFILPFELGENLVFCTTKAGIPVPIPHQYKNGFPDEIKLAVKCDELNWHAIVPATFNCTIPKNHQLKGTLAMSNKYKEKFNYKTSYIAQRRMTTMTGEEKVAYLATVIQPFVSNDWLDNAKRRAMENVRKPRKLSTEKYVFEHILA